MDCYTSTNLGNTVPWKPLDQVGADADIGLRRTPYDDTLRLTPGGGLSPGPSSRGDEVPSARGRWERTHERVASPWSYFVLIDDGHSGAMSDEPRDEMPISSRDRQQTAPRAARLHLVMVLAAGAVYLAALVLPLLASDWSNLSAVFLDRQDQWLLLDGLAILTVCSFRLRERTSSFVVPPWLPWALAASVFCFCIAGHIWILDGYDLSRDEKMASFDAMILKQGRLVQPLPTFWQTHADALNTRFMLTVSDPVAWASSYLPMNAALRALVGLVAAPSLTGPLVTALGLLAVWNCARRLWPSEREPAMVAAILYAGSGQVLFAGMTSYAMPAHLTLDLLWLWLFLIRKPTTDVAALAVGLVATGLHQPLFHPLFALPFLAGLLRDRDWPRVFLFAGGYAVIGCVWLSWPLFMHSLVAGPHSGAAAAGTDYLSRLVDTVFHGDSTRLADMAGNLLRFAAWQPILLLPLIVAGVLGRQERPTCALAVCLVLPILVMGIILPYQGHGFGYRYLHGVIGPAILLSAGGWRKLSRLDAGLRSLFVRSTVGGVAILLPLQASMAHAFYAPFARIDARIRTSGADYVIVGQDDAPFARDLVINRPDLSNRPIGLLSDEITDDLIAGICRPGIRVAMTTDELFAPWDAYLETPQSGGVDARFARLSQRLETAGCTTTRLADP